MLVELKPYPEMKDSGVQWMGEVPMHWKLQRFKDVAELVMGQSPSSTDCSSEHIGLPFLQGCAEFGLDYPQPVQYCRFPAKDCPEGAILLSVRAPVGRINLADQQYGIGRGLCAVIPNSDLDTTFAKYYLGVASSGLLAVATGSTYDAVSVGAVSCLRVALASLSEQTAIARFLDHADRNIQRYIQSREQLIALLGELKKSVIQAAVTGRIDVRTGQPYPKMKDSGLERVGNVPSHWDVRKLSSLFRRVGSGTTPSNEHYYGGGIPWVMSGDLNDATLRRTARTVTAEAVRESAALRVYPAGSLVIAMYGATIGVTGIMSVAACTNQACFVLTDPVCGTEPLFVQTAMASSRLELVRRSFGGSQPNISAEILRAFRIVVPPPSEQAAIATHLDKVTTGIESAIQCAKRQIQLFREYRARLIADVVTGKLDVREAVAARLPDTDPIDAKANGRSSACESTGAECDEMLVVAENEDG